MAAAVLPPPPAIICPLRTDSWSPAEPQATEGRKLRDVAGEVLRHWQRRSEFQLAAEDASEDYNSVPLQAVLTARVTYRRVGRLQPLPYQDE